jgi:hypothetical protein
MYVLALLAGTMYLPTTPRIAGSDAKPVTTGITLYGHLDVLPHTCRSAAAFLSNYFISAIPR